MAYLDMGRDLVLSLIDPIRGTMDQWREGPDGEWLSIGGDEKEYWRGPAKWFGPFACPGGEWPDTTVEFEAIHHAEAERLGKALVLLVIDTLHCLGKHGMRTIHSALLPPEATLGLGGKVFDPDIPRLAEGTATGQETQARASS